MDDVLKSLWVAIGFKADDASKAAATKSVEDYQRAVERAEKAIEDARWAGAKTEEEVARLTRETNLRLAKEALERAKKEERDRAETDKKQAAALKEAKARIGDFVKVAIGMGAAIEAAALGVHAGVVKMAQGFDTLNFTSQRTGVTVRNIQAIGYAASQMGSTVEAGVGSLENFARTLRQSPGSYSLLERLGIKTTDASGARRSADALFQEFGKALKDKPGYLQDAYLQDFGIDEKTGRALIQGLDKFTEEYNEKLRKTGLDPDKAAKDAAALQRTFGSLAASISIIGQKVASNLFSGENNAFQKFIDFLDQHGDEIAAVISHIAQVVLELARALLELVTSPEAKKWFDTLMLAFGDFDKETGKFTANTEKMKVALGVFGTFIATTWLSKILGAFGIFGNGWKGLLAILGIGAGATGTVAVGTAIGADLATPNNLKPGLSDQWDEDHAGAAPGGALGAAGRLARRAWGAVKRAVGGGGAEAHTRGGEAAALDGSYTGNDGRRSRGATSAQGRENVASWMDFLQKPVADGGLGMPKGKAQATIAMMQGESGGNLDPGAIGDSGHAHGTAQWSDQNGNPRFPLLRKYAESQGKDWRDRTIQQQYLRMEMLGLPGAISHRKAYDAMMGAPTDEQTLYEGISKFENPQKHALAYQIRKPFLDRLRQQPAQAAAGRQVTGLDGQVGTDLGDGTMRMPSGAIRSIPANAPTASAPKPERKPVTAKDILPNGIPGAFNGNLPSFTSPAAPATSNDNSKTVHVSIKQGDTHVRGVDDPKRAADHIGTVAGYRNSDLVRNLRSSLA
ncbi:phage tail-type lysozyme domain-containing protein [Methylobacterium sp. NMS14P]|uniref:phage tail tip lysozyme n=1 Tax=Methylobacterium sp. NMS14P TaxID=2894310 RepID=UPI0023593528|nr:phage tail tip lysozyme [Methylobacterium sp. NMS14P]WCS27230.1 phage tail-type lysozyme domain-containing protein [Methylobacterium sp. NMS14P]